MKVDIIYRQSLNGVLSSLDTMPFADFEDLLFGLFINLSNISFWKKNLKVISGQIFIPRVNQHGPQFMKNLGANHGSAQTASISIGHKITHLLIIKKV